MIVIAWPVFWVALIPIILIEYLKMKKIFPLMQGLLWKISFANIVSTVVGIPLAWGIMVLIEFIVPGGTGTFPKLDIIFRYILGVSLQSAWLMPYLGDFYWMIPTAFLFLLIPFFIMSYWIEYGVIYQIIKKCSIDKQKVKEAVWKANINSYLFLAFLAALSLVGSTLLIKFNQASLLDDLFKKFAKFFF